MVVKHSSWPSQPKRLLSSRHYLRRIYNALSPNLYFICFLCSTQYAIYHFLNRNTFSHSTLVPYTGHRPDKLYNDVYHLNLVKFSKCAEMTSFFTFLYSPCLSHQAARCLLTIYLIYYTIYTSTLIIVKIADGLISSLTLIRARSMACPLAISNSILFIKRKGDKYRPIWLLLKTWHLAYRPSRISSLYIYLSDEAKSVFRNEKTFIRGQSIEAW